MYSKMSSRVTTRGSQPSRLIWRTTGRGILTMPRPAVNDTPGGYLPFGFGRVSTVVVFGFAWAFLTVMNRPLPASRPILVDFDATCLTSFRSGGSTPL